MAAVIDVSNEEQVTAAVEAVVATDGWGAPRVLVQCAGIAPPAKTVSKRGPHSLEKFAQVLNVNTVGTFNVLRLVADKMQVLRPC
jgi:NAD(P)-dependent dehydrogenase (short-subunit alcohol dehydrogenase family)